MPFDTTTAQQNCGMGAERLFLDGFLISDIDVWLGIKTMPWNNKTCRLERNKIHLMSYLKFYM